MPDSVKPFRCEIPQDTLADLRRRLDTVRWPEAETVDDWSQGVPLSHAREVIDHWKDRYDWRRCEAMLNDFGQFTTCIDGLDIHFIHRRSRHENALPLLITHGWPGSVIEFHKVIEPLVDPESHGGRAEDAFHVIAPSLPGYGFSGKPEQAGWGVPRIAAAWATLMQRLGYDRYVAQGGDWGSAVTSTLGRMAPAGLAAIHLNMVVAMPNEEDMATLTDKEKQYLAASAYYRDQGNGYAKQQSTRPQTLGYALADSPVGQAMWIYEKFYEWTDCDGDPRNALSLDEMLDNIMLYWLPNNSASSGRLYWESFRDFPRERIDIPVACSIFPKEIFPPSRRWAERLFPKLVHWNELDRGGHFAAFEQPEIFVKELRDAFAFLR